MAFKGSRRRGTTTPAAPNGDTMVLDRVTDTPPAEDSGLAAELAAAAPRKWFNKWTIYLAAALLLTGGFLGGIQVQQRYGTAATSGPGGMTGFPGGGAGGYGGMQGGGLPGGGAGTSTGAQGTQTQPGATTTEGTVKLVNGATVYIETADGRTITVRTGDSTEVRTATAAQLSDLAAGDTVTIQGTAGENSSVTATTITEQSK